MTQTISSTDTVDAAQAGEAKTRDVVRAGGFTQFQRVAATPFDVVFEARP